MRNNRFTLLRRLRVPRSDLEEISLADLDVYGPGMGDRELTDLSNHNLRAGEKFTRKVHLSLPVENRRLFENLTADGIDSFLKDRFDAYLLWTAARVGGTVVPHTWKIARVPESRIFDCTPGLNYFGFRYTHTLVAEVSYIEGHAIKLDEHFCGNNPAAETNVAAMEHMLEEAEVDYRHREGWASKELSTPYQFMHADCFTTGSASPPVLHDIEPCID